MINLIELQREIDDMLNEETDETLLSWYNSKINQKVFNAEEYVGVGEFIPFTINTLIQESTYQIPPTFIEGGETLGFSSIEPIISDENQDLSSNNTKFAMAA